MRVLNVGFGNIISLDRIISVLNPDAAPVKRIVKVNKSSGLLLDATCGRKTQSVIIMDSGHVILSALRSEILQNRVEKDDNTIGESELD